jgi:hypothetical protein
VLAGDDPGRDFGCGYIRYPLRFWKVFTCLTVDPQSPLGVYAFVLDQSGPVKRLGIEAFEVGRFRPYQVTLQEITGLTGIVFDKVLLDAEVLTGHTERVEILDLADVRLRRDGARKAGERPPVAKPG